MKYNLILSVLTDWEFISLLVGDLEIFLSSRPFVDYQIKIEKEGQ